MGFLVRHHGKLFLFPSALFLAVLLTPLSNYKSGCWVLQETTGPSHWSLLFIRYVPHLNLTTVLNEP